MREERNSAMPGLPCTQRAQREVDDLAESGVELLPVGRQVLEEYAAKLLAAA